MADVSKANKQLQITLSLAEAGDTEEIAKRTFSVDLANSETAANVKTRATAFKTAYMQNYANFQDELGDPVGSLIQVTNWRDTDNNETALKCIGMTITFIDKTQTMFDI